MAPSRYRSAQRSLAELLGESPRAWSRAFLEERWSKGTVDALCRSGEAVRLSAGIVAHATVVDTVACRVSAASLWMAPHGRLTGLAALWLWGARTLDASVVDVTMPEPEHRRRPSFVRVLRTEVPCETAAIDHVPVLGRADATIHAWRRAGHSDRAGALFDILRDASVSAAEVAERVPGHPIVPERSRLMALLGEFTRGVTSVLELRARTEVFEGSEWVAWEWQAAVVVEGRPFRPDMLHRGGRIAVEFDGARFHSGDARRRRDLERDALFASAGYTVIRFTWEDITRRPGWCRARVRAALRSRNPTTG